MGAWLPLVSGLVAVIGVLIALFRWRRDDTGAVVDQHSKVIGDMRELIDRKNIEEDRLRVRLEECRTRCASLEARLRRVLGNRDC